MTAPPESCDRCGFTYADVGILEAAERTVAAAEVLGQELVAAGPAGAERPGPASWSAVEYAGHVRDVLLSIRERTVLATILDEPVGTPIYREERIALGLSRLDSPETLAVELKVASDLLRRTLLALPDGAGARTMRYSAQTTIIASVAWMAAQAAHEAEHHLADVRAAVGRR